MKSRKKIRAGVLAAAALAVTAVGPGTGAASASTAVHSSTTFHSKCWHDRHGEYEDIVYDQNNHYVGLALFEANGDRMQAADHISGDGYYITAVLALGGYRFRYATTNGHGSVSPWATGNLPERHKYLMWVAVTNVKTGLETSLPGCWVVS